MATSEVFLAAGLRPSIANAFTSLPYDRAVYYGVEAAAELFRVYPDEPLAETQLPSDLTDHADVATRTLARMVNDTIEPQPSTSGLHFPLYYQWAMSKCGDAETRFSQVIGSLIDPSLDFTDRERQGKQIVVDDQGEPLLLRKRRASNALTLQECVVGPMRVPEGFIVDVDLKSDDQQDTRNGLDRQESSLITLEEVAGICPGRLSAFAIAASQREEYFPTDWLDEPPQSGLESQALREFDIPTIREVCKQAISSGVVRLK